MSAQKPLELILARNLLSSISTPAFLVSDHGTLMFYNEAAGALLGPYLNTPIFLARSTATSRLRVPILS